MYVSTDSFKSRKKMLKSAYAFSAFLLLALSMVGLTAIASGFPVRTMVAIVGAVWFIGTVGMIREVFRAWR